MTDKYNTSLCNDPQSVSVIKSINLNDRIDPRMRDGSKPTAEKSFSKRSKLYEEGLKFLNDMKIYPVLDRSGTHCGHNIYIEKRPPEIKGINYDGFFTPQIPMFDVSDFARLEQAIESIEDPLVKGFWFPLIDPKPDSELSRYVDRLISMGKIKSNFSTKAKIYLNMTHDPSEKGVFKKLCKNPITWIPSKDWFSEEIKNNLKFEDVFTIFPPAETEIIKLWLGRVAVGTSNHVPPNSPDGTAISHTARMAVVVVGKNAGLGKSTIFNYLLNALNSCGHSTTTFKSVQDKFGLKIGALSSVLYKDDVSDSTLESFLSAEETKILISNGILQAEDKFVQSETIIPRCSILINTNSWSTNFAYNLDSGIQSRIKAVSTYSNAEMQTLKNSVKGISKDSPDLRPYNHIPWLAKKLNCDPEALFLWCARLAADEFYQLITDTSDPSVNKLEERVYHHTSRLRYRFKSDILSAMVQCMALCKIIVDKLSGNPLYLPEFNLRIFYHLCKHFYFFGIDPSTQSFVKFLRDNWELKGRVTNHSYQSFRDVRFDTFKQSLDWLESNYVNQVNSNISLNLDESSVLKKFTSFLMMRDGFKLSGSISLFIESWNNVRYQFSELSELADNIVISLKKDFPEDYKRILAYSNEKVKVSDDWTNNLNYSPDTAQVLRDLEKTRLYTA